MLAYTYPLLNIFWTILIVMIWIMWIFIVIRVVIDIFSNSDMGGFSKAIWFLFVVFFPIFGVLMYLIVHGGRMHERANQQQQQADDQFKAYVREAAGSGGAADELAKLAELKKQGVITDADFEKGKAKILG